MDTITKEDWLHDDLDVPAIVLEAARRGDTLREAHADERVCEAMLSDCSSVHRSVHAPAWPPNNALRESNIRR